MSERRRHRVGILCTAARQAALNNWIRNNLDKDPTAGDWLDIPLSASGNAPATHYACCALLSDDDLRQICARLANLASLTLPGNWSTFTRAERIQWVLDHRAEIRTATGIAFKRIDNDRTPYDFQADLTALGLKVIGAEP